MNRIVGHEIAIRYNGLFHVKQKRFVILQGLSSLPLRSVLEAYSSECTKIALGYATGDD